MGVVRVRILGAGVAGLACALAMRCRCGFDDVLVLERDSPAEARIRVGHGLLLMPNGVSALQALGADAFLARFRLLDRAVVQDSAGVVVESEALDGVYCVTRAGLVAALRAELPAETVEYGRRVTSIELLPALPPGRDPQTIRRELRTIEFESGPPVTNADADLFIGAEGWHSPMYVAFNPGAVRQHSQVFEIVSSVRDPALADRLGSTFVKTVFADRGLAFGLLSPTDDVVIGFLQFDTRRHGWPLASSGPTLRDFVVDRLGDGPEPIASYLRVADFTNAHVWRPVNADLARGMCGVNAVIVGDAAHPLLPFTSQGVGSALEDAVILADALRVVASEPHLLPRTLAGFSGDRGRDMVGYVQGGRRILSHFIGDVQEFVAPYVGSAVSNLAEHLSLPLTDLASMFGLLDTDRDGYLSREDLGEAVSVLLDRPVGAAERDALFGELDTDGDGLISRQEMVDGVGAGGDATTTLWELRRLLTPRRVGAYALRRAVLDAAVDNFFAEDSVDVPMLRERAYNHRWAVHAPDVIPLTAADSDFPVCGEVIAAVQRHLADGYVPYGPVEGLPEFRRAAAEFLRSRDGLACEPDTIFPTDGAASAIFLVARFAIAHDGDEAIIPDPVDFLLDRSVRAYGGVVKRWPVRDGRFDADELEALITPRTRLLSLCNPHNPLGRVLRRDELEAIATVALRHDLWILSDEVWSGIVFPPHRHIPIATIDPAVAARTLTVHGFSKSYGLAGMRLGLVVAPDQPMRDRLMKLAHANDTAYGASTVSQVAGTAAYGSAGPWLSGFLEHLRRQRDYAVRRLNEMEGVRCDVPEGTFLVFPDISGLGVDECDLADRLLERNRVAVVPGSPAYFGPGAAGHVRLSLATSRGILTEGLNRFESGARSALAPNSST